MHTRRMGIALYGLAIVMAPGCSVTVDPGGGGSRSTETLLTRSGVVLTPGQLTPFTFEAEADRLVTISVQANTDHATPDFVLVAGVVDSAADITLEEAIIRTAENRSDGQAVDEFTPATGGSYTLFVEDTSSWPGATFSVLVAQRR